MIPHQCREKLLRDREIRQRVFWSAARFWICAEIRRRRTTV